MPFDPSRILDANAHRAAEGLRVIEDYVRFAYNDRCLTEACKQLRHELTNQLRGLLGDRPWGLRDTDHDVGQEVTAPLEFARSSGLDILVANWSRVQQALRSLEEFGKLRSPSAARDIEGLRYRSYVLEKATCTLVDSRQRLINVHLYMLLGGHPSADALCAHAELCLQAGAQVLQLREKGLEDRELLARARRLRQLTREHQALLIINDRPDIGLLADADGVHVGQTELTVADARAVVGPDMLVGVSTHSLDQAHEGVMSGADYLGVGPIFPSQTKRFCDFPGIEFLRAACESIQLPLFAIGGIGPQNVDQIVTAGCRRIAVSQALSPSQALTNGPLLLQRLQAAAVLE